MKSKSEIKVLHLISSLGRGGSERLLVDTIKGFNENSLGIKNIVVVMNNIVDEALKEELSTYCKDVYFLQRPQGEKNLKYLFQLNKIINENKINVIHTHNFGSKHWSIMCKIIKPSLKLVYTFHDTKLKDFNSKIYLHNFFIHNSIAISKAVYSKAKESGIKKVEVIFNGTNIKRFKDKNKEQHAEKSGLINVSRLIYEKKGQDILIKAINECIKKGIKVHCCFVGQKDGYCTASYKYLQKLVKDLKLEDYVTFLGSREDVAELLKNSQIFILPSRFEGFGLAILEAMAAGVPVIASNIDGPAEIIEDNVNGLLFEKENYVELSEKILYLLENKDIRDRLSRNASNFINAYDISVMCEKYSKLYKDLIG